MVVSYPYMDADNQATPYWKSSKYCPLSHLSSLFFFLTLKGESFELDSQELPL